MTTSAGAFARQPAADSGAVKGDLTKRWDAALAQVRAHAPRCTCEGCVQARGFLDRMVRLIDEIWPTDRASPAGSQSESTERHS